MQESINVYFETLKHINTSNFKSEYLNKLKDNLTNGENDDASAAINKLSKIYDKMRDRNNAIFIIINILLLWNYRCMIEFEKWKSVNLQNKKRSINHIKCTVLN